MTEPRRLRGHNAAATCCIASDVRPNLVATAAEDGSVCWYDLRCKDMLLTMDVGNGSPVSSLCFKPGNEDIMYVSVGNEIKCFDLHLVASWKQLDSYDYNKDEINQIACHPKSSFVAAADDAGDVKIIDVHQRCLYKTLRAGHTSICSSVQFLPWRSWEVITGGLDSKLMMWDFSRGRPNKIMDFGTSEGSDAGQCCNPAFLHALVVPDLDIVDRVGKICVAARGDGVVSIINIDSQMSALKSKMSRKPKTGAKSVQKGRSDSQSADQDDGGLLQLDYSMGGHVAAVSSVTFSMFGEKGKFVISGGNDKSVKVWDWSKAYDAAGRTGSGGDLVCCSNISLRKKVNWLCTTPSDSENLVVCDTSKVVKVYTVG